jgi:hypothetical protein
MRKTLIIALLGIFTLNISAQDSGFGVGVIFGEPTGLSLKSWLSSKNAVDAAVTWSSIDDFVYLHADFLIHSFDVIDVSDGQLPLYYGIGAKVGFGNDLVFGARIPVGLDYMFSGAPVDIFVEIVPGLTIIPAFDFDIDGGIGVRYWF